MYSCLSKTGIYIFSFSIKKKGTDTLKHHESQNNMLTNYSTHMKPNNTPKECIYSGCLGWEDLRPPFKRGHMGIFKN